MPILVFTPGVIRFPGHRVSGMLNAITYEFLCGREEE